MRRQAFGLSVSAAVICATAQVQGADRIHELKPSASTVHRGFFDASLKPVLTIDTGDIVRLWTATGNPRYFESLGVAKEKIPSELYAAYEGAPGEGRDDHNLDGPIAVRGAEPGDTVEIRIRAIDLWLPIAAMSFRANKGSLPEDFPYSRDRVFFIDPTKRAIEFAPGVSVPVKPFWGVIGVAPPRSMGRVPSGPPNVFGGNMDNHDLQPGTSLFLPVHVPGALISIGDGHAVQGDGEVGMSAVETSLKGEIQVVLHKGMHITWPRAETPTHYMTMGLHEEPSRQDRNSRNAQFHRRDERSTSRRCIHAAQRGDGPARDPDCRRHEGHPCPPAEGDFQQIDRSRQRGEAVDRRVRPSGRRCGPG